MDYLEEAFDIYAISAIIGGNYMTKTKYEKTIRELEEKEGKLFSIPEISNMFKVDQFTIHSAIRLYGIRTISIKHYKTQRNITLLPATSALRIVAKHTSCIPMLNALAIIVPNGTESTIEATIKLLESFREEA